MAAHRRIGSAASPAGWARGWSLRRWVISDEDSAPAPAKDEHVPEADQAKAAAPVSWIDPIRALELYFGLLQAALDANRQFVMGLANAVVTGGTRLRGGLGSVNTRP